MIRKFIFRTEEEWLAARRGRIGGSDAAAIIGMNPYKTNVDLWKEKAGLVEPEDLRDKPQIIYGKSAEDPLRQLFMLDFPKYRVTHDDYAMYVNDKFPFAHASLDGELMDRDTGRFGILEIKTANIVNPVQFAKWENRIPDNYYCQLLWYLMVTERDFAILKAKLIHRYGDDMRATINHYFFERAETEEDIKYLSVCGRKFYESIQQGKQPALILPEI